jgi:hypothetical protein
VGAGRQGSDEGRVWDPRSVSRPPSAVVPRDSGTAELEADTNGVRDHAAHGPWRRSGTRRGGSAPYSLPGKVAFQVYLVARKLILERDKPSRSLARKSYPL